MLPHDFRDAPFLFQDIGGEWFGRQARDAFLGARVLAVEVAADGGQFPGVPVPVAPHVGVELTAPGQARGDAGA
ncbi:MAG: hypothetical protein MUE94_13610 [Verrucomicrobia bacterium]|jgi:hypothetical protein|nr:hypothetical protein [Verrucomicrobiota bacterium]